MQVTTDGTFSVLQWVGSQLLGLRAGEAMHHGFVMSGTAAGMQDSLCVLYQSTSK